MRIRIHCEECLKAATVEAVSTEIEREVNAEAEAMAERSGLSNALRWAKEHPTGPEGLLRWLEDFLDWARLFWGARKIRHAEDCPFGRLLPLGEEEAFERFGIHPVNVSILERWKEAKR